MPEDVGPSVLEVADQDVGRLVHYVERQDQDDDREEEEEHGEEAGAARSAVEFGGDAEEVEEAWHGKVGRLVRSMCGSAAGVV